MRALQRIGVAAGLLLAAVPATQAEPLALVNPGFEADAAPPGAFLAGLPTGWQLWDPSGRIDQVNDAVGHIRPLPGSEYFPGGTPEGDQAALIYLAGGATGGAAAAVGLEQTLAATLQPLTHYQLQVGVGNIASGTSLPGSSDGGGQFYDLSGFPGYRIELWAGGTLLARDDNSLGALIPEGEFRTSTLSFVSGLTPETSGQALRIRLVNLAGAGIEVDFDDVRLQATPVPEPRSAWLLAAGLWLLLRRRRAGGRAAGIRP